MGLREMLDEDEKDQLWAVPLDGVAWASYRDRWHKHYYFDGRSRLAFRRARDRARSRLRCRGRGR
jgi:hypothetical protein